VSWASGRSGRQTWPSRVSIDRVDSEVQSSSWLEYQHHDGWNDLYVIEQEEEDWDDDLEGEEDWDDPEDEENQDE
jgi:hypothetical protein